MKTALKLVFFYLAYQVLAGALMAVLAHVWTLDTATQLGWSLLLSGAGMAIHLIALGYVNLRQILRPVSSDIILCSVALVVGAIMCGNALGGLLALPDWLKSDFEVLGQTVLGAICIALVAPWVEELMFRGAIMQSLATEGASPWRSITLSALIFGLIHINPAQILFAFLMGLALGWITWCTRSLWPAIVGHVLNNGLGVIEIIAASKGVPPTDVQQLPTGTLLFIGGMGLLMILLTGRRLKRLVRAKYQNQ